MWPGHEFEFWGSGAERAGGGAAGARSRAAATPALRSVGPSYSDAARCRSQSAARAQPLRHILWPCILWAHGALAAASFGLDCGCPSLAVHSGLCCRRGGNNSGERIRLCPLPLHFLHYSPPPPHLPSLSACPSVFPRRRCVYMCVRGGGVTSLGSAGRGPRARQGVV